VLDLQRSDEIFDDLLAHDSDRRWAARGELAAEALPTAMKKVAVAVLGSDVLRKAQVSGDRSVLDCEGEVMLSSGRRKLLRRCYLTVKGT
jgi:hypothetical protein